MAFRIKFDNDYMPIVPSFLLAKRNGDIFGLITNVDSISLNASSDVSSLSFKVYKYDNLTECTLWDEITDFKLLYCIEWDAWFEITVQTTDGFNTYKDVSATHLPQSELSQIILYDFEANTEDDIAREDYTRPTVIYDPEYPESSLLHRILKDKAPHYSIVHVDESLAKIQRTFEFDSTSIKDALDRIAEEINAIVIYGERLGNSRTPMRTISLYDLCCKCGNCDYRGDLFDICPKCGSTNVKSGYGKDTNIFVSKDNLTDDINYSVNTESVKNCFRLEAGDELMTSTIANCNPNGTQYIWYFSDDLKNDMPSELVEKIDEYSDEYEEYETEHSFALNQGIVTQYNNLIRKYIPDEYSEKSVTNPVVGFGELIRILYDVIDFKLYLSDGMLPTYKHADTNAQEQIGLLTNANLSPISVANYASVSKATVDNYILDYARVLVDYRYEVKIVDSSFDSGTSYWTGNFKVTNYSDDEDTQTGNNVTVLVSSDYSTYVRQKIDKLIDKDEIPDFSLSGIISKSVTRLPNGTYEGDFVNELKKYNLSSLKYIHSACQSVIDLLAEEGIGDNVAWTTFEENLYNTLYYPYYNKLCATEYIIKIRDSELNTVTEMNDELVAIKDSVQDALNIQTYFGDELWSLLCSYRREDSYSNPNFISDGLTNIQLLQNANEFYDVAKSEIIKSSTLQHSISSTLKNLLTIKEFRGLVESFEIYNWIRVQVDERIFKLRLIEYSIDFDNLESVQVTFSDVIREGTIISDSKSLFNNLSSIASTYNEVTKQSETGVEAQIQVKQWKDDGFSADATPIVNNSRSTVQLDEHGILLRTYDEAERMYNPTQLKIINSTLAITDDSWLTTRAAIGQFKYTDPETGRIKTVFGVNGDTIVGKLLLGESLGIYNDGGTLKFDANGLWIENGNNYISINPNSQSALLNLNASGTDVLIFDSNGNLSVTGNIHATSFTLGNGVKISTNDINGLASVATTGNYNSLINKPSIPSSVSDLDDDVGIMKTGDISITEVENPNTGVTTITTVVGENTYTSYSSTSGKYLITDFGLGVDSQDGSRKYFKVDTDGLLTAKNAIIWGTIHATSGEFVGEVTASKLTLTNGAKVKTDDIDGLSAVATTGNYNSLINKPTIPSSLSDLTDGGTVIKDSDVTISESTSSNGIKTTTTTVGSHTYTTYTSPDGKYLLTDFGVGHENPDSTQKYFKVDTDGLLTAKNAIIWGTIHASNGEFAGEVSASTLYVGHNGSSNLIINNADLGVVGNDTKPTVDAFGYDYIYFDGNKLYMTTQNLVIGKNGNVSIRGDVTATSFTLADGVSVPSNKVSGLASIATSGNWGDLRNVPNDIVYDGDIDVTESIDPETHVKTTTTTVGSHTYTTYTSPDGKYLLTNIGVGHDTDDGSESYFVVDTNGLLTAKNAIVWGTIYATNGRFTGEVYATNGRFSGEVSADTLYVGHNGLSNVIIGESDVGVIGNDTKPTVDAFGYDYIYFDGENLYMNTDNLVLGKNGNVYVRGDIVANSFTLGSNATIPSSKITGLSSLAYSGKWDDLENVPRDIVYADDITVTETTDARTGIKTTTTKVGDKTYTSYTSSDGRYLMTNFGVGLDSGTYFMVDTDGLLTAKNAIIWGTIHATSGEFVGEVTASKLLVGTRNTNQYIYYDGSSLEMNVSSLSINGNSVPNSIEDASEVATNYLYYDSTNGLVITQNVTITDSQEISYLTNGNIRLTGNGIYLYNGTNKLAEFTSQSLKFFYFTNQAMVLNSTGLTFYKPDGTTIAAQIDSTNGLKVANGKVGGFTIDSDSIYNGTKGTGTNDGDITLSTYSFQKTICGYSRYLRFSVGQYFGVGADGTLYCGSGIFDGTIYASDGYFGDDTNGIHIDNDTIYLGSDFWISSDGYTNIKSTSIGYGDNGSPEISIETTASSACLRHGMTSIDDTTNAGFYLGYDGLAIAKGNFKATADGNVTAKGTIIANTFQITKDSDYSASKPTTFIKAEYLYNSTNAHVRIGQNVKNGSYISLYYASLDWTQGELKDAGKIKISAPSGLEIVNNTSMFVDGGIAINDEKDGNNEYYNLNTPEAYIKRRLYIGHIDTSNSNNDIHGIIDVAGAKDSRLVIAGNKGVNSLGDLQAFDFISSNSYRIRYTEVTNPGTSVQSVNANALVDCIEAIDKPSGISYSGGGSANQFLKIGSSATSYSCIAMPVKGDNIFVRLKNGSNFEWYDLQFCLEKAKNASSSGGGTSYSFNSNDFSISNNTVSLKNSYLPSGSLNGYATENWVTNKGYATTTWVNNKNYSSVVYTNGTGSNSGEFTGVQSGVLYLACFHFDSAPNSTALYMFIGGKTQYQAIKSGSDIGITLTSSKFSWTDSAKSVRVRIISLG